MGGIKGMESQKDHSCYLANDDYDDKDEDDIRHHLLNIYYINFK